MIYRPRRAAASARTLRLARSIHDGREERLNASFLGTQLVGDGTVIGRLTSMPTGSGISAWAKAGIMMRNDLTPGSMNALCGLNGTHGQRFSVRASENGASTRSGNLKMTQPYWFKITRSGNTFTGYSSPDGVTWSQVGAAATIPMSSTIYAGIAVTSKNESSPITTGFDSLGVLQQPEQTNRPRGARRN